MLHLGGKKLLTVDRFCQHNSAHILRPTFRVTKWGILSPQRVSKQCKMMQWQNFTGVYQGCIIKASIQRDWRSAVHSYKSCSMAHEAKMARIPRSKNWVRGHCPPTLSPWPIWHCGWCDPITGWSLVELLLHVDLSYTPEKVL